MLVPWRWQRFWPGGEAGHVSGFAGLGRLGSLSARIGHKHQACCQFNSARHGCAVEASKPSSGFPCFAFASASASARTCGVRVSEICTASRFGAERAPMVSGAVADTDRGEGASLLCSVLSCLCLAPGAY
jgi:hypothetical protein